MKTVEVAKYYLPNGRGGKHASRWKMTAEEAKARAALGQVPGTAEARQMPETEEETRRAQVFYQSAGHDGAKPPQRTPSA